MILKTHYPMLKYQKTTDYRFDITNAFNKLDAFL